MVHLRTQEETPKQKVSILRLCLVHMHVDACSELVAGMSEAAEDDSKGVLHQNIVWNYY